tara:strand:+ start:132 stop:482 length:351 start_codon:yes stop_codon:yes gene_type:complete
MDLVVTAYNGELEVKTLEKYDDDVVETDLDETNDLFWTGCVLFWHEETGKYCDDQIDAIARLARFMGVVPCHEDIERYAVPSKHSALTYKEMIDALIEDGNEKAKEIKDRSPFAWS